MWHRFRAVGVCEAQCHTIIVEFDPLSWTGESMAAWDAEVGNASIVEDVTLRGPFEGLLIFEDVVLKCYTAAGVIFSCDIKRPLNPLRG